MVAEIIEGQLRERDTLLEALSLIHIRDIREDVERDRPNGNQKPRIAAVGAGGKTTILKRLAEEYLAAGEQSVITTTTHMKKEDTRHFLVDPSIEEILKVQGREGYVIAGAEVVQASGKIRSLSQHMQASGKIRSLPQHVLDAVLNLSCPVLIEADGARMLPVKIPAEHEPVLLSQVTCVLALYGLDAPGKKIRDVCFRAERMTEFLHKGMEDRLGAGDIAALALSSCGGRKCVTKDMQYRVVLNKADTEERRKTALEIWRKMEQMKGEYGVEEVRTVIVGR